MIKLATVFSGIGAVEHALKRMELEHKLIFACDNGDINILSKKIVIKNVDDLKIEIEKLNTQISLLENTNTKFLNYINKIKEKFVILNNIYNKLLCMNTNKIKNDDFNEASTYISMLYEQLLYLKIYQKLNDIKDYDKQKEYIDSLYLNKENRNKVMQSYLSNYDLDKKHFHWNILFLNGNQYKNQVDLFVGGSPCQSFSLVGKQKGLFDTRGELFYEFIRLVEEMQPKVFIYENVKGILSNDHGRTWQVVSKMFTELHYNWSYKILNSKNYGIPQNRERIFVVGFRKDLKLNCEFEFPVEQKLENTMKDFLLDYVPEKYYLSSKAINFVSSEKNISKKYTQINGNIQLCQKKNQQFNWHGDFVTINDDINKKTNQNLEKYFLSEKTAKYVMSIGTKNFYLKPKTDLEIARPLLTTMHKMHRAGVDNYVTTQGKLRKLTPRECLRLMGFCDSFKITVSDTSMYQQAGNSIVVDVLIAIIKQILKSYNF